MAVNPEERGFKKGVPFPQKRAPSGVSHWASWEKFTYHSLRQREQKCGLEATSGGMGKVLDHSLRHTEWRSLWLARAQLSEFVTIWPLRR